MLRVNHDGRNIHIKFYYSTIWYNWQNIFVNGLPIIDERRITKVKIYFPDESTEFQGRSICHPADNFCKSTGRKLALANAMKNFDRNLRTAIWKEYHRHCK